MPLIGNHSDQKPSRQHIKSAEKLADINVPPEIIMALGAQTSIGSAQTTSQAFHYY